MDSTTTWQSDRTTPFGARLEARWRLTLLAVFALAMAVRFVYALEIRHSPIPELWRGSQTDMYFFVAWAKLIAAGDWLTDRAVHPYFSWQRSIGPLAEWNAWYGGKTFHQAPLYPYLLAVVFKLLGPSLWTVYALQSLGSAITAVLLTSIARRLFNPIVGLLAGVLTAVYGPLVFYDFVALRTSLTVLASAGTVWLLIRAESDGSWRWWLASGVAIGLAYLLRPNAVAMLVMSFPAVAVLLWRQWRGIGLAWLGMVVGFGLCLAPLVARNVRVGVPPLATSALGGSAVYLANAAGAPGTGWGMLSGYPEAMRRTGGRFGPMLGETFESHSSIMDPVGLCVTKLGAFLHYFERSNNANPYYAERFSLLLRWGTVCFWLVLPFAVTGLVVTWPSRRRLVWLYLALLVPLATIVLFYQTARFRVPIIVGLIPPAAVAIDWMYRHRGSATVAIIITVLLAMFVRWPRDDDPPGIQQRDFEAGANVLEEVGRYAAAVAEAREEAGRFPKAISAWMRLTKSLRAAGLADQAAETCDKAIRLFPGNPSLRARRAEIFLDQDRPDRAVAMYRSILRTSPRHVLSLIGLSRALAAPGPMRKPGKAVMWAANANRLAPDSIEACLAYANALTLVGRKDHALQAVEAGLEHTSLTGPLRPELERLFEDLRKP